MKIFAALLFVLLMGLQWRLWFGDGAYREMAALEQEVEKMVEKNTQQMQRNQMLEAEVQDLKHRMAALEERARTNLGMIRKGESFFQHVQ